jgi:sorting and assembly machinery component 37
VPLKLRAAAIAKTEHLGLDHLAADVDPEDGSSESKTTAPTTSTGFLRLPIRPSVGSLMQPEQAAAIRLQSLTEDFFSVLDEALGGSKYFLGREEPSSLDFLAFGYLRLLRVRTPHPFMETCMKRSQAGSRLWKFLDAMHADTIRWQEGNPDADLPWTDATPRGVGGVTGQFVEGVADHVPALGPAWKKWRGEGVKTEDAEHDTAQLMLTVGAAVAGLAALGAAVLFKSLSPLGASVHRFEAPRAPKGGLHQFGAIGDMLAGLPDFEAAPRPSQSQGGTVYKGEHVEVAVEVESEGPGLPPPRDGNITEVGVGVRVGDRN